ncbi:YcxB family protein [Phyllobacterium meliloti]|uniref:YcxB family protein n=1 Tax=Phyllobacterium meliloti TaxID=555317 RepID=UPI001D158802|nr:YcxB family protein [Phyllobacterium sp. T1293]UGX86168.1 YcxB family protein [Phyllobacterium sp. T1293]
MASKFEGAILTTPQEEHETSKYQFSVRYTESMLKRAVRTFIWRRVFLSQWIWWLLLGGGWLLLLYVTWTGAPAWPLAAFSGLMICILLFVAVLWQNHFTNTVGKLRRMEKPYGHVVFSDDKFTLSSDLGSSTMPWSAITEIWQRDECWMVFIGQNQFFSLPTENVPAEALKWLLARTVFEDS